MTDRARAEILPDVFDRVFDSPINSLIALLTGRSDRLTRLKSSMMQT